MAIPQFDVLEAHYPDYVNYATPDAARRLVGGEALEGDITNTCAIRMSHAMNQAGVMVPRVWEGILNRRGARGWYYIIRVANFRTWLTHVCGKPNLDFRKQAGDAFDRSAIESRTGIIALDIGFGNATGHVDLWDGHSFSSEQGAGKDYFRRATRVSLWTTATHVLKAPV